MTNDDMLFHYSAALDEIYRLRQALAIEARSTEAHLQFKTFPKSQRPYAERQIARMRAAARGEATQAYQDFDSVRSENALRAAGADVSLSRHQWEARELTDADRRYLTFLRNTEPA
jgi:hypothetical protein